MTLVIQWNACDGGRRCCHFYFDYFGLHGDGFSNGGKLVMMTQCVSIRTIPLIHRRPLREAERV